MIIDFNNAGLVNANLLNLVWRKSAEDQTVAFILEHESLMKWEIVSSLVEFSNFSESHYISVICDERTSNSQLDYCDKKLENLTKIILCYREVMDIAGAGPYDISESFYEPFALICESDSDVVVVKVSDFPLCIDVISVEEEIRAAISSACSFNLIWHRIT